MKQIVETPRLRLEEFGAADAAFVLRLLNEPSFIENIADRGVRSAGDALGYLSDGPMASYARHGFGLWRVTLKESGEALGMCGLIRRDTLEDIDIGYAFLPEFCRQGYATEAAAATMRHAFDTVGAKRLVAIVSPGNDRSVRLLLKLGFAFERMVPLREGEAPLELYAATVPA